MKHFGVYLFVVCITCVIFSKVDGAPVTPEKYYALKSSTVELPCAAGNPKDTLTWTARHADNSHRSRQMTVTDTKKPGLSTYVIRDVQPSDAGNFICSDGRESSTVEMIVFVLSHPEEISAQITAPDEVKVKWEAPLGSSDAVIGYNIYVREYTGSSREATFVVKNPNPSGKEEFVLEDMAPGATFVIQVAALYAKEIDYAGKTVEGPRSPDVRINTPIFDAPPSRVRAEPGPNSTIIVTWQPPHNVNARAINGYIVSYQGVTKRNPPSGKVTVRSPGRGNQWMAFLSGLRTRIKYKIHVTAISGNGKLGRPSQEIVFRHDGFNPEISIRAMPLGPETVLVTLETLGPAKVAKLRLLYSDDSAIKWKRVKGYKPKERYAVVTGLQPRSRYFFMAKAKVSNKARQTITDVLTPPTGLTSPIDVSVTAQTDNGVLVTWNYAGPIQPKGFIVLVERQLPNGQYSPYKQHAVFNEVKALVRDLSEDQKYQIKVVPFDLDGKGPASEPVLFQIAQANVEVTTPQPQNQPPRFVDSQPEYMEIDAGENVKLTCTALGFPFPTVMWFKDGAPIGEQADRRNEIFLSRVQQSTVLTCTARNPLGSVARETKVDVVQAQGQEPPTFVRPLPEFLAVDKGFNLTQICAATGNPTPRVTWYKDNFPVRSRTSVAGRSEFVETNVQRSFSLKCVAENKYGRIEDDLKVLMKDFLQKPVPVGDMPKRIEKDQGDSLSLPCSFSGNPVPTVRWYDRNTPIGEPALSQNTLQIASVEKSTFLRCRGQSAAGEAEVRVQLLVRPRRPDPPDGPTDPMSEYSISIHEIPKSASAMDIKWVVDRGNLDAIRMFQVTVSSDRGQVLMRQRLSPDQRSIKLTSLTPNDRYTMDLLTITRAGVVDRSTLNFVPSASKVPPAVTEPELQVDIVEVRDSTARVDFTVLPEVALVAFYRLRIQDLEVGPIGNTIFDRRLPPNAPSINLERLKPLRRYQCIVDATLPARRIPLTSKLVFVTAAPGEAGKPVSSSSASPTSEPTEMSTPSLPPPTSSTTKTTPTAQPEDTTTMASSASPSTQERMETRSTTTRRTTTEAPSPPPTTTTMTTTMTTTTTQTSRSTSAVTTTSLPDSTTESPEEDDSYVMTVKTANKTPYRVDIRWTVDRGDLEGVKNFMVTIKGDRGQTLLQQELSGIQRSITIQSLSPDTKYFVNVKLMGENGELVEYDLPVQTPPADSVPDTSNPVLDLEANEIRSTTARLDWIMVNAKPDLVKSYRLRVLDGGPGGFNLLTQNVSASSLSLNLQKLLPDKSYHVIVDALDASGREIRTSSLTFKTARPKGYGIPVRASSAEEPEEMMEERARSRNVDPTLNTEISPVGPSSAKVIWNLENVPSAAVQKFIIRVRSGGQVLLENDVPPNIRSFTIDGLLANRQYIIEVEALGSIPLISSTPYSMDRGTVRASSAPSGDSRQPRPSQSRPSERRPNQRRPYQQQPAEEADEASKPTLNLEINPVDAGRARLNWTLANENNRNPVRSFRVKLNEDGPEGRNLLDQSLPRQAAAYTVTGLRPDIRYYILLEAVDPRGQPLASVESPYLVPPPGHSVAPIRASSDPEASEKTDKATPDSSQELVIVKAESKGPTAIYVEWVDVNSPTGEPRANTMLRYAEFIRNQREPFKLRFMPAGLRKVTITALKPDSVYGFQVASAPEGSVYVRWSDLVMRKTDKLSS